MKKILLLFLILIITGCNSSVNNINKVVSDNKNIPIKYEYVDLNPLKLSLYADENSKAKKVSDEMYYPWILKKDITVLNIFLTEDEYVTGSYYKEMWNKYTIDIDNLESYKFGWEISFEVNNNLIHKKILKPSDAEEFYDYLEIYLYDCVNHEINEWYSHLLDNQVNDDTIISSMKLTCGQNYDEITSDIIVKAYSYDTEDDFDENGFYKGNSFDEVIIKKSN